MRYTVLLQQRPDGRYQASAPAIPGLMQIGNNRVDALNIIQQAILSTLTTTEVVYLDIPEPTPAPENPWLATAGMFANDPTLEPLLEEIYASRDEE